MKVGDYVRTKKGIFRIKDDRPFKGEKSKLNYIVSGRYTSILKENIIKSSPNIIDLIEVGDILKFKDIKHYREVLAIDNEKLYLSEYIYMSGLQKFKKEIQEDLEWVVTHEQIESMKYEVK